MAPLNEHIEGLRERKAFAKTLPTTANVVDNAKSATKEYTWEQVAQHNSAQSAWIVIDDVVYDVTEWADRHPGGRELILIHAGRECTDTFNSYHPFSDKASKLLSKFRIGKFSGPYEFPVYKRDSGFYRELCERVGEYFEHNKINPKDPFPGLWRMAVVYSVAFFAYMAMNKLIHLPLAGQYAAGIIFGVCQALPLLHVMHDSSHASHSKSPMWWRIMGRVAMDFYAGGNMVSWLNQHVIGHHIYTNVAGADPDLPVNFKSDVRRIVERQVLQPIYKYQHWYLPPLYGLLGLKFRFQDIFETFLARTNGPVRVNPHSTLSWIEMVISKSVWAIYRLYIPLAILKVETSTFWGVFLLAEFVTGWYLAFNFQVSHVSTECDYPNGEVVKPEIEDEWAVSQIRSSVDYHHGSWWVAFCSGALNYQTTHHLFPGVSQYHYPAIAPIIIEVCKKYKVKYNVLPTFREALVAHFQHLKVMGAHGKPVSVHMG